GLARYLSRARLTGKIDHVSDRQKLRTTAVRWLSLGLWRRLDLRQDGWNEAHLVVEELFWWYFGLMKSFRLVPGGGDLPSCWRRRGRCARDVGFAGGVNQA